MENTNVIEGTVVPNSQLHLSGVLQIPAVKQLLLLIGVAAAVAAGFAIVLWSQTPGYTQLYGELSAGEAADVAEALRSSDIDFKLNTSTGGIMVAEASLHDARMQLASQGLPQSVSAGMGMLDEQSSFGVSQFMENARYQHALEAELARTIASLGAVREARIHLALPKQTSFIRDQKHASASVLLQLFNGAALESDQASAIVHLVASSVPNLAAQNVTLIDQYGRLLSSGGEADVDAQAASEFKYSRRLEETYKSRIEELLMPLLGPGRVRAQVVADVDFTVSEQTRESFDPASTVVRSEQLNEQNRSGDSALAAGVPGALSNQPPDAGADAANASASEAVEVVNTSRSTVRNYEVDRTISRTRPTTSTINKLSVAVLVDDSPLQAPAEGAAAQPSLTDADIERYTALVKEAVGFNEARGDTVVVVSAAFREVAPADVVEPPPFWEKPMLRDILKQVLGATLVLALAFGIV
ncbi:MAG: flagellar M-ring protein FliF, partial [Gammaproteobacteria bacterium]|nr:flagellar M-ring protein FliF [Gammaproteobacteria bacterium]